MSKINVTLSEGQLLFISGNFTISKGEIKAVVPTVPIIEAIKKGVLIKVV